MANPTAPADQILVLHCLKEDSLLGREGFSVRAASTGDTGLQQWALSVDHYELPFDMRSGALLSTQTPRRLALVPAPGGRVALVHSSYLKEDTRGRPHSFISHILVYSRLDTLAAAEAWGSDEWRTDEYERGATKSLPPFDDLPHGVLVGDDALSGFLAPTAAASADQSLARVTFPARLAADPEARRRWLRAAVNAYLKTLEPGATRNRVCILAEPGMVALLVYALARLLPPQLVGAFPFSTYEPPQTSLRENKVHRVVGSYARGGFDNNEIESLRRRGYVLDMFRLMPAAELGTTGPWPLEPLIEAAAAGDWQTIDEVRGLWVADSQIVPGITPTALGEAVRLRPLVSALREGTITAEGLAELWPTRIGQGLSRRPELRTRAWETLRPVWSRPEVARAFEEVLGEHSEELLEATCRKATAGPPRDWRDDWPALKKILPAGRRAAALSLLLQSTGGGPGAASLGPEERAGLLCDWFEVAGGARLPDGLGWLLTTSDEPSLRALLAGPPPLEGRAAGVALCHALGNGAAGPGLLEEVSDDHFLGLLAELDTNPNRQAVLQSIIPPGQPPVTWLAARVLRLPGRDASVAAVVEILLTAAGADDLAWFPFWLEGKAFPALLERLGPGSKLACKLGAGLVGRLALNCLDAREHTAELATLVDASRRFPNALASDTRRRIEAWDVLNTLVNRPGEDPGPTERLKEACKTVGTTPEAVAERYFRRRVAPAQDADMRKTRAQAFATLLIRLFGTTETAFPAALKCVESVPDEQRRLFKEALFRAIVPERDRDRLFEQFSSELSEIGYVRRGAAASRRGGPSSKSGRNKLRLPPKVLDRVASFLLGAGMTAAVLGLFWQLNVFDRVAPIPRATTAKNNPVPSPAPEAIEATPGYRRLSEENATLKQENTKLVTQVSELRTQLAQARAAAAPPAATPKSPPAQASGGPPAQPTPAPAPAPTPVIAAGGPARPVQSNSSNGQPPPAAPKSASSNRTGGEPPGVDVPTDNTGKLEPAKDRIGFAFVTDGASGESALVTLRNTPTKRGQFRMARR